MNKHLIKVKPTEAFAVANGDHIVLSSTHYYRAFAIKQFLRDYGWRESWQAFRKRWAAYHVVKVYVTPIEKATP